MIDFTCPHCHATLEADVPHEELQCPACQRVVKVPERSVVRPRHIQVRQASASDAAMQSLLSCANRQCDLLREIRAGMIFLCLVVLLGALLGFAVGLHSGR